MVLKANIIACAVLVLVVGLAEGATQPSNVGLGGNVDWFCGACDYYGAAVFVNAFKQSRRFGVFQSAWDTTGFEYNSIGVPTNQNQFGALVFDSLTYPIADTEGTWTARVTGANVTLVGSRLNHCCTDPYNLFYNETSQVTTANFNCTADCLNMDINFIVNSGNITNVETIRPGYPIDNYPTFTESYLKFRQGFNNLRFMDWAQTNGNPIVDWDQRNTLDTVQYGNGLGIPWEAAIELANTVGSNLWVNIPSNATDDYMLQMAKLFKSLVAPNLIVFLEFTNEPWNSGFQQTQDSYRIGPALYATGNYSFLDYDKSGNIWYMAYRWTVWRAYTASNIWRGVWGDDAINTHVRVIINSQLWDVWISISLPMIDTCFGPPANFFYAVAIAPYFGMLNQSIGTTEDEIWNQIDLGGVAALASVTDNMIVAKRYGLELLCYEGGATTGGASNVTASMMVNLDPRLAGTVERYLQGLWSSGVRLFNYYFVGVNTFTGSNDWGVVDSIFNTSEPKYVALRNMLNANRADYEYPYIPPPGMLVLTPQWSFVPQSDQGWPTSWDTGRWDTWQWALGENNTNGAYYELSMEYSSPVPINMTVLVNNENACTFVLSNSTVTVNATACTLLTVPRANVFFYKINNFPVPSGSIFHIYLTITSQTAPPFQWLPMSYPPTSAKKEELPASKTICNAHAGCSKSMPNIAKITIS